MRAVFWGIVVFAAVLAYAVVRYVVFKGVSSEHVPVYILNKAVAVMSLYFLGVSIASADKALRRRSGMLGFAAAGLHVLLTQPILTPAYLPKLFIQPDGSAGFGVSAEAALLCGALGFLGLFILAWPKSPESPGAKHGTVVLLSRAAVAAAAAHCLFLGGSGWFNPATWPGFLPPITLLAFVYACAALALSFRRTRGGAA